MSKFVVVISLLMSLILAAVLFYLFQREDVSGGIQKVDQEYSLKELDKRISSLEKIIKNSFAVQNKSTEFAALDKPSLNQSQDALSEKNKDASVGGKEKDEVASLKSRVEELVYRVTTLEEDPINRGYSYLGSGSPELRRKGVQQLRRLAYFDPAARDAIRDMLDDSSVGVKLEAIDALGDMKDKKAAPAIMNLLADASDKIRSESIQALGKMGAEEAGPAISDMLSDASDHVRERAADVLGQLHFKGASDQLLKALGDKDEEVRGQAIASLGEVGAKEAQPYLREIYENNPGRHKIRLVRALKQLGDNEPFKNEIAKVSQTALSSEDPRARWKAIRTLSWFARSESKEVFKKALNDQSSYVKREAERALRNR